MKGIKFRVEEVLAYLEEKVLTGEADDYENEMYEDYKWNGIINKLNYNITYVSLVEEMKDIYNGK